MGSGLVLTVGVDSEAAFGGLAVRSHACCVAGAHPELVLRPFDELQDGVLQGLHRRLGDRSPVDTAPVDSSSLPLLQPVALDGGASVVQRRVPGHGHGGGRGRDDLGVARRSGETEWISQVDLLRLAAVADATLVLSLDPELEGAVGEQFGRLKRERGV